MKRCIKSPVEEENPKRFASNHNNINLGEQDPQLAFIKQALTSLTAADSISESLIEAQLKHNDRPNLQTVVDRSASKQNANESSFKHTEHWSREDTVNALNLEKRINSRMALILSFPDPELNCDIVSRYSSNIESVYFQSNFARRSCVVYLKDEADCGKTIEEISKIPFGKGFISAELKPTPTATLQQHDEINPCVLCLENLTLNASLSMVKNHFPGARRYEIVCSKDVKNTKCAFIHYSSANAAMEAFERAVHSVIDSRPVFVRFKRINDNIGSKTNIEQASCVTDDCKNLDHSVNETTEDNNLMRLNENLEEPQRASDFHAAAPSPQSLRPDDEDNNEPHDTENGIEFFPVEIKEEFDKDAFVDDLYRQVSAVSKDDSCDSSSASNDYESE